MCAALTRQLGTSSETAGLLLQCAGISIQQLHNNTQAKLLRVCTRLLLFSQGVQ
jgi:hypothetical protein